MDILHLLFPVLIYLLHYIRVGYSELILKNLNKVVVLNPKGGCGKSTIATNLSACYAARGSTPAIMDYDPQGSTLAWLERRPKDLAAIHGIAAFKKSNSCSIQHLHFLFRTTATFSIVLLQTS